MALGSFFLLVVASIIFGDPPAHPDLVARRVAKLFGLVCLSQLNAWFGRGILAQLLSSLCSVALLLTSGLFAAVVLFSITMFIWQGGSSGHMSGSHMALSLGFTGIFFIAAPLYIRKVCFMKRSPEPKPTTDL